MVLSTYCAVLLNSAKIVQFREVRHNYPAHIVCCTIFPILELRVECSICFGCKTFDKVSDFSVIYNRDYILLGTEKAYLKLDS